MTTWSQPADEVQQAVALFTAWRSDMRPNAPTPSIAFPMIMEAANDPGTALSRMQGLIRVANYLLLLLCNGDVALMDEKWELIAEGLISQLP